MKLRLLSALGAAVVAFLLFRYWRDFPQRWSLMLALAIGALVYSTFRTVDNLRSLYRK